MLKPRGDLFVYRDQLSRTMGVDPSRVAGIVTEGYGAPRLRLADAPEVYWFPPDRLAELLDLVTGEPLVPLVDTAEEHTV
jgi:hypothetical protein